MTFFTILFNICQAFSAIPTVQVTVQHGTKKQKQDAMHVWMENVTISHFEVCLRESRALDGGHNKIVVVSCVVNIHENDFHSFMKLIFHISILIELLAQRRYVSK